MAKLKGYIKIIGVPTGDIPDFVKEACLGLVIPFYDRANPDKNHEFKIGSGIMEETRKDAFCVMRDVLLSELSLVDSEASDWLQQSCPTGDFSFGSSIAEIVNHN